MVTDSVSSQMLARRGETTNMKARVNRRKIVGVMGSGVERHEELTLPLGALLARLGVHLLTGGGQGVMAAVSEGFVAVTNRTGLCFGILPGRVDEDGCGAPAGYPNTFVEVPIQTHLPGRGEQGGTPLSRNSINIATADAVVILPGGAGTASEARLALQFGKPAIAFGCTTTCEGIVHAESLGEVEDFLRAVLGLRKGGVIR